MGEEIFSVKIINDGQEKVTQVERPKEKDPFPINPYPPKHTLPPTTPSRYPFPHDIFTYTTPWSDLIRNRVRVKPRERIVTSKAYFSYVVGLIFGSGTKGYPETGAFR